MAEKKNYTYEGKPIRQIAVKDLPVLGEGTWSFAHEMDNDRVIKVFKESEFYDTFENAAKCYHSMVTVWKNGIPAPQPLELVQTEASFGIIMKRLHGGTVGAFVAEHPECLEEFAVRTSKLLKKIHSTRTDDPQIQDGRNAWRSMVDVVKDYLTPERREELLKFIADIPATNTFVHGDFHTNNIMIDKDEIYLIDIDEMGVGHPVMDLADLYAAYIFVATEVPDYCREITGMTAQQALKYWELFLKEYLGTDKQEEIVEASRNIRGFALLRKARGLVFTDYGDRSIVGAVLDDMFSRMPNLKLVP